MLSYCPNCGAEAAESARYCHRCGNALPLDGPMRMPPTLPRRRRRQLVLAVAAALALAGLAALWTQWPAAMDARRIDAEIAQRREAEQRLQAELQAVRKRAEEVEQALIDAEQEAAIARRQPGTIRAASEAAAPHVARTASAASPWRVASGAWPGARPPASSPRALLAARRAASQRQQQEALERQRAAEEAALTTARTPPPAPPPAPAPQAPAPVAQAPSPEQLCRSSTNPISRAICETRECIKPEFHDSRYCASLRARHSRPATP